MNTETCTICYEDKVSKVDFVYCKSCVNYWCSHCSLKIQVKCPFCRCPFYSLLTEDESLLEPLLGNADFNNNYYYYYTFIDALVDAHDNYNDPDDDSSSEGTIDYCDEVEYDE